MLEPNLNDLYITLFAEVLHVTSAPALRRMASAHARTWMMGAGEASPVVSMTTRSKSCRRLACG
jgi:hypothetical protein